MKYNLGTIEERLLHKLYKTETCWIWTGWHISPAGYGILTIKHRQQQRVHRLAYKLWVNPDLPNSVVVTQTCHNRLCCNPEHLFAKPWSADLVDRKKATRKGSDHPNARFSLNEIKEIRRLWNTLEFKQTEIAQMYNTSQPVIQRIVTNKSWIVPEGE